MNNKCSWIRAVLFLAALVAMVDQSAAGGIKKLIGRSKAEADKPRYERYPLTFLEKYSTNKLNGILGYSMPRGAFEVASLLALGMDKDKEKTILGKFSVNELLDWNYYYSRECTPDGLVERRKKCDGVDPKQIDKLKAPLQDDSQLLELVENKKYTSSEPNNHPLEYLKYYNLHTYCTSILAKFEDQCHLENFLDAKAKVQFDQKTLDKFNNDVNWHIQKNEVAFQYDYRQVVHMILAKASPVEAEQVKTGCKNIVNELGHFEEDKKKLNLANYHRFKLEYFKICRAVVN